jgi:hypothetical protein
MANGASKRKKAGWEKWTDVWVHRITIPALLLVTAYMLIAVRPPRIKLGDSPSFTDVLLNNRAVVLAAWIIVVNGAIFLFASLLARTAAKEWANKAGPVGTGDDPGEPKPDNLADLPTTVVRGAGDAMAEIKNLTERLTETESNYARAVEELKEREEQLRKCEEELKRRPEN